MWLLLREFTDGQNPSVSSSNQRVFSGQKPQTVPKLEIIRFKIQKFVESGAIGTYEFMPLGQIYNNEYIIW